MFPSNSYMDPYFSQNKEQIPYPPYPFYPYPVQNRPDPSAQPASYAPWPYHFNPPHSNGYPYPPIYYGPRSPFPYEMPPPNFPNYYHPYFAPMPNQPAKYPQVEPTTSQTHCCGCPNHVCHGTGSPKVKIEEEMPDMDQTKMPTKIPNNYPFFWFSPQNKVQQDEVEEQKGEKKGAQFPWPIVWTPEDETKQKENKNKQFPWPKENKNKEFPWPIIWMPDDDTKERKGQHVNKGASEEAAKPNFRIIPLKFLEHGDQDQAGDEVGKEWRDRGDKEQAEVKRIPVLGKKGGDKDQAEVKKIPVIEKKEGSKKLGKEQSVKEKGSTGDKVSEKKHSKLPPVCLRVDPLPHKKPTTSSPQDRNKKEVKVIDVKNLRDDKKERETEAKRDLQEKLEERKINKVCKPEEKNFKKELKVSDVRGAEGERELQGEEQKDKLEEKKVESVKKPQISEQDAALLIQSIYRGYNVRRWDPLKKLKKIRSVHEKAQELLAKLQHVEKSSMQVEKKELLVLSESIMNLLLQLDTIQGLHPIVREARKSVARELVSLQEKLDSLEKQKAVAIPTSEGQQGQLEEQPTAEGSKSVSEQVVVQPSEAPSVKSMTTQTADEKACGALTKDGSADKLDAPQATTDSVPANAGSSSDESQVTSMLEGTCRPPESVIPPQEESHGMPEESLVSTALEGTRTSSEESQVNAVPEQTYSMPEESLVTPTQEGTCSMSEECQVNPVPEQTSNMPKDYYMTPVLEETCSMPESLVNQVLLKNEMTDVLPETIASNDNLGAQLSAQTEKSQSIGSAETIASNDNLEAQSSTQTEKFQSIGSAENVGLHDTGEVPSVAIETNIAPAVTLSESGTDASHVLSESDVDDTVVTSSVKEEIHDTQVAPNVAVTDVIDAITTLPETQNLDGVRHEEEIHVHETESNATELVDLQEAVVTQDEGHGSDIGASVKNVEFQSIEDHKPSNEENKLGSAEIESNAAVIAAQEVENATDVLSGKGHVNEGGMSAEDIELPPTDVHKLEENKSGEEYQVTDFLETENLDVLQKVEGSRETEHPNLTQTEAMEGVHDVDVTDSASDVSKLSLEEKKLVEENERLRVMLEKFLEAGKNQLDVISGLNERVKGLEKKLEKKSKKSKVRVKKHKPVMASAIKV